MCSWEKAVIDLINRFSSSPASPLLEILTVLPEEVNSRALRLGANRKKQIILDFNHCAPNVLEYLVSCESFTD